MRTRIFVKTSITFLIGIALIIIITFSFSQCKKDNSVKPGTIQLKATSQSMGLKSATIASVAGTITLQTATVEIGNLRIEENSGNDNQNGDQSGNDGVGGNEKNSKAETGVAGDLHLAGPYLLDILNGSASIDKVTVQPGIYKKVNFEFIAGSENKGHSIALSGVFVNAQGVSIPFTLTSEVVETIQLPLTGSGIQVNSGNMVSISILFDVSSWLTILDFSTASQNGGRININKDENTALYLAFITEVSKNIDIEK